MSDQGITRQLAAWTVELGHDDIPPPVREQGVRTFVNWLGCAVGGATPRDGRPRACGHRARFPGPATAHRARPRTSGSTPLNAALVNGISSHVLDYDDTHLKTIIHPAGPVASALLAVAESAGRRRRVAS